MEVIRPILVKYDYFRLQNVLSSNIIQNHYLINKSIPMILQLLLFLFRFILKK